jgi:hypothetical protein
VGWTEVGFGDGNWRTAVPVGGTPWSDGEIPSAPAVPSWTHLVKRDIPEMETNRLTPEWIEGVSECIHLTNRRRSGDRSIILSQLGGPVTHTTIEDVEALCKSGAAAVQNSTDYLEDHTIDGV